MERIKIACLIIFLICSWQIKPDNPISKELGILDTISRKDLSVSGVWVGLKKSILLTSFGKPDSIVSHVNEFEGTSGYQYYYKSSSFHIENDKFSSFDLKDDSFYLDYGNIRVGESIDKIKHLFPSSYKEKEIAGAKTTIRVRIGKTDSYLLFMVSNNQIQRMMMWDDL